MSALTAFASLSGAPPPEGIAARMLAPMARRGPDGLATWADAHAALGHAALFVTPEAPYERMPRAAGPFVITADARLDERDALRATLHSTLHALGLDGPILTDAALLLAAHARWGPDAPNHLTGDFAYVVWDARERRLTAARDRLGVRQLYVRHVPGAFVALATEPDALLELPGPLPELDEARLADAVTGRLFDPEASLYEGIRKVPSAHTLTSDGHGVQTVRYWSLQIGPPPPGDAAEAFAEVFETAVRRCTRTDHTLGSELSGGMDSSAVTLVAADAVREKGRSLHTFSARFSEASGSDEQSYIDAVLRKMGPLALPHTFYPEQEDFLDLYSEIFDRVDDGRVNGNHHFNYLSMREAHRAGVRVLLTGQDGDTTVGHGWLWLAELAEAGRWDVFLHEASRIVQRLNDERDHFTGQATYTSANDLGGLYMVPVLRRWAEDKQVRRLWRGVRDAHRVMGTPYGLAWRLVRGSLVRPRALLHARRQRDVLAWARANVPSVLRDDVVDRTRLVERLAARGEEQQVEESASLTAAEAQRRLLSSPFLEGSFEKLDRYAGAWAVEARHPFMDVDLVQLCLSLPASEKLHDGLSRSVMRRALAPRLPGQIAWRANKANLNGAHDAFLMNPARAAEIERMIDPSGPAAEFLDPARMAALWARRHSLGEWESVWLTNALALAYWLVRREATPGVSL